MNHVELLVDADAFWQRLQSDLQAANHEIMLQMMTFEGDQTGQNVIEAMRASAAPCKQILVDNYTRFIQSDKFIYHPKYWSDQELKTEVRQTHAMFEALIQDGGQVRFTNPVGPFLIHFVGRSHKKLIVIDNRIAYVGGFNFSDHNFAWHDLMFRLEDPAMVEFLRADFVATWQDQSQPRHADFGDCEFFLLDGRSNEATFAQTMDLLCSAQKSLHIISPYLTFPFCGALAELPQRGVPVTLLTPEGNNKGTVRDYLLWEAQRSGFDVRLYDGMSHMKAALVDDRYLVVGSSNFDFLSYRIEEEVLAIFSNPAVIETFRQQVLEPDLARCRPFDGQASALRGWLSYGILRAVETLALFSRRIKSTQVIDTAVRGYPVMPKES
ncbi:phosphatidylserine/phosphatidylglycerophosphate/cardiolipin synthase family protein [Acaryochloris sp. 'Moss Beach']|uniref:phospholipase D-like domain-containing protein n=1 Tax=Acaryochloris TaxID=155977 RepID=UPI001BAF285E|nr:MULTISPECIES: phosphatidylserine/phosphatidylglycerophosphate/cardiolipin synthase family protein [Acaryochloris]QUY41108.1 phosphatidylserine/phosphatidylglycerophosphate/cardiolipin synthase family protein [Acaryochloris marina S15]UJB70278.1 phosphatidylserine/phosphatidylglycerophosphate/cardiolipin synthase family protein [Acaryochloris sp. 'Moss Beach']